MNEHTTRAAGSAPNPLSFGRVLRLAHKELRETLRDRRTIITLVLMPLLVYPVLGVALKQFLITSILQKGPTRLFIRTDTQDEFLALGNLLRYGDQLVQEQGARAAGGSMAGGSMAGGSLLSAQMGENEGSSPEIDLAALSAEEKDADSLENRVRNNDNVDLGVRLIPTENAAQGGAERRFQLIYRPNLPLSRQAADFVEQRLRAVNEYDLRQRLANKGDLAPLKTAWRLIPVAEEKGHSFWLGALMPLVLILMTITGAVYPAIDLTAGERERGTLESLMAAPVSRFGLLIAKYVAVVTVATMTAVINLTAMVVTLTLSGKELWTLFFGNQGSPVEAILAVFLLLILFAMFFSAVLLLVTSFARSFKEAQAYVVPLMVVALAPGFMSVMPGLTLGPLMSVIPLSNIVLLARDVMEGHATFIWGAVAVFTTLLYGGVALALAARVFGSDAILYGSEGTWADLFQRPRELKIQATITDALSTLALIVPTYVLATGVLGALQAGNMVSQLLAAAGTALIVFAVVPVLMARYQGLVIKPGFQLLRAQPLFFVGTAMLGATLWPLAYDSIILCQRLGIDTLNLHRLTEQRPELLEMIEKLPKVPIPIVLFSLAIVPGIVEEFFFRGYLLGSLRGRMPAWLAIGLTGMVFGLFHANVGGIIAVERVLSSTLLGLMLGWICWMTRSVYPGMVLHVLNNSIMLSLPYLSPHLKSWGWDAEGQNNLPPFLPPLFVVTTSVVAVLAVGVLLVASRRGQSVQTAPA